MGGVRVGVVPVWVSRSDRPHRSTAARRRSSAGLARRAPAREGVLRDPVRARSSARLRRGADRRCAAVAPPRRPERPRRRDHVSPALRALAKRHGVQREWRAGDGRHVVADETLLAVLQALGAPLASVDDAPDALRAFDDAQARRVIEPTLVQWGDHALVFDVRVATPRELYVALDMDDGTKAEWNAADGSLTSSPVGAVDMHRVT